MEEFEYKGLWWLPQKPDYKVAGTLKFNPNEGATLELLGDSFKFRIFETLGTSEQPQPFTGMKFLVPKNTMIETICGHTEKGDEVTLYNCWEIGENFAVGYTGSIISVQVIFVGCHFKKESDIVFDKLSIGYNSFQNWLGIGGFTGNIKTKSKTGKIVGAKLKYALPKQIVIKLNNFTMKFYPNLHEAGDRWSDIHFKQHMLIEFKPERPLHYNDYYSNPIYNIRNFISFATGNGVLPIVIKGQNKKFRREIAQGKTAVRDIYIYYAAQGALRKQIDVRQVEMLFRYTDIAENFENHIQSWFDLSEKIRPVIDLYFGIFYIPSMYVHLEFLTLAQVIETYHRTLYGGEFMSKEDYSKIAEFLYGKIPTNLDADHVKKIRSGIRFGYEYSFIKRLDHILETVLCPYKFDLAALVGDYKTFARILVDTRNYLTHHDPNSKGKAIDEPHKQSDFAERMKLLIQLCFFAEIGIPPITVHKLMLRNGKFRQYCYSLEALETQDRTINPFLDEL